MKTSITHYICCKTRVFGESNIERARNVLSCFFILNRLFGSRHLENVCDGTKTDLIFFSFGRLRPEGRLVCILGAGPAECASPAEALELAKTLMSI